MKSPRTILGIALILLVNILALIGVARNRAAEPVQTIELTERELPLQTMGQDNSGVMLRLAWSAPPFRSLEPELDRARLEAAGFSLHFPAGSQSKDIALMPREAYVALEYEGAAWERWLKQAEEQKKNNQFPAFETIRQMVDKKYWFPVWTHAEDRLRFDTNTIQIEETISYEDYKRFAAKTTIQYEPAAKDPSTPQQ